MNKFDTVYKTITESLNNEWLGVADLYTNLVLDEVQIAIKNVVGPVNIQIEYFKEYTILWWENSEIGTIIDVVINEDGSLFVTVKDNNDNELYKNDCVLNDLRADIIDNNSTFYRLINEAMTITLD